MGNCLSLRQYTALPACSLQTTLSARLTRLLGIGSNQGPMWPNQQEVPLLLEPYIQPCILQLLLGWIRPLGFYRALHTSKATFMYVTSLVSALSDPCKYCPSRITLFPVLISRNKKSVVGNFNTSKDPWVY